eukprot:TRINITY_DN4251_c0_g1_i11.p1 TRINITY_DN4251_c0_g1~~TRINITY_DN4251_c0_g1_i11.p1  ORF type:complete len:1296 (-),score=186.52 TRINITY_DN4251_c0_g1_i11:119-4006(-)
MDHYTPRTGSPECVACQPDFYSFPGDKVCSEKLACKEEDYDFFFGPCENHSRSKFYEWSVPTICNPEHPSSIPLPLNETLLECADCNPGLYRFDGDECLACPSGSYRDEDSHACMPCEAGTAAVRTLYLTYFHEWPLNMKSSCEPLSLCATSGWRLLGDHIDSGLQHSPVSVFLEYEIELETAGSIQYEFGSTCLNFNECYIQFYINEIEHSPHRMFNVTNQLSTFNLHAGNYTFVWVFHNRITTEARRARINSISITGTKLGGAIRCDVCPMGSYSEDNSEVCSLCPAGSTSPLQASQCEKCPPNTFAPKDGSESCTPCGVGSYSQEGATSCQTDCIWSPDQSTIYDLTPLQLSKSDGVFGPLKENGFDFYINVCKRDHVADHGCIKSDGSLLETHVCQVTNVGAFDLGNELSFASKTDMSTGFVLQYLYGDEGCFPTKKRSTIIDFVCDQSAGIGYPAPVGSIETPPWSCQYRLVWNSRHACRLCTTADYTYIYSDCVNNKRSKIYYWLQSSPTCFGGETLPPAEHNLDCAAKILCSSGHYLPPSDSKLLNECVTCGAGTYSPGSSTVYQRWKQIPNYFDLTCNGGPCAENLFGWHVVNGVLKSGMSEKSSFSFQTSTVSSQSKSDLIIRFKFVPGSNGVMKIFENNVVIAEYAQYSEDSISTPHVFTLTKESTVIKIEFLNGNEGQYAYIDYMEVTNSAYALSACLSCPPGYYSASTSGASDCLPCEADTYSEQYNSQQCKACPSGSYSRPGSISCEPAPACTIADTFNTISSCSPMNTTMITPTWLQPKICKGGYILPSPSTSPCQECKSGYIRDPESNQCVTCSAGTTTDPETGKCAPCPQGSAAIRTSRFESFSKPISEYGFVTGCDGLCGTSGWRSAGLTMDSGAFHYGPFESFVKKSVQIYTKGDLEFSAQIEGESSILAVYIDAKLQLSLSTSDITSYRLELQEGSHTIQWSLYGFGENDRGILKDIVIHGDSHGAASACISCGPGEYSAADGMDVCEFCPPGYASALPNQAQCEPCIKDFFSVEIGAHECKQCGAGTESASESASMDCTTDCKVSSANGDSFTIAPLGRDGQPYSVKDKNNNELHFSLCQRPDESDSVCPSGAFACLNSPSSGLKAGGDYMSILAVGDGVIVRYTDETQSTLCPDGVSTNIIFKCALEKGVGVPVLANTTGCVHFVSWETQYGCKVCNPSDYVAFEGRCVDGQRTTTWIVTTECHGQKPDDVVVDCDEVILSSWVVVGIIVGVVGLASGTILLWHFHRKLKTNYQILHNHTKGNTAMEELEEEDV